MTAAAPASPPAASGNPGGRIPPSPLHFPRGLARPRAEGGGRWGRRPAPTWPRRAADPIAGAVTPAAPGGPGAGKGWGRAPSGRSAGQCSGPGSPSRPAARRPAAAATSGRALAAASPLARPAPQPRRHVRPQQARPGCDPTGGGVSAEVTHTQGISGPARVLRGMTRVSRASLGKRPGVRTHVLRSR